MKKMWFSSSELVNIDGLPSTIQGINQKARKEHWRSQKRLGVQGKAVEYHIDSLPTNVREKLKLLETSADYTPTERDPFHIWFEVYNQLMPKEKELISAWLIRNGISKLINIVKDDFKN